jgi:hypothetical protein
MLVSLPLAGFVLLFSVFREEDHGWRSALILAATTWGVLVVLITEVLSLQPWLTKVNLAMAWLLADIAILSYLRRVTRRKAASATTLELRRQLHQRVIKLGYVNIGLLVGAAVIIVLIGVIALASPPNTWDAMVYHMPRVSHWMQNRSVAFYPTHVPRQLHMPPWAEFAMLHLHMLFGGDRLNNLVQWFSLFGSVVAVSLLAQALGAGYRGQALAAVICATIPQGILQASAAKNDYVVAFWLAALAYCVLSFKREPTWTHAFGIGGALGLAWLTKGTGYILTFPFVIRSSHPSRRAADGP